MCPRARVPQLPLGCSPDPGCRISRNVTLQKWGREPGSPADPAALESGDSGRRAQLALPGRGHGCVGVGCPESPGCQRAGGAAVGPPQRLHSLADPSGVSAALFHVERGDHTVVLAAPSLVLNPKEGNCGGSVRVLRVPGVPSASAGEGGTGAAAPGLRAPDPQPRRARAGEWAPAWGCVRAGPPAAPEERVRDAAGPGPRREGSGPAARRAVAAGSFAAGRGRAA